MNTSISCKKTINIRVNIFRNFIKLVRINFNFLNKYIRNKIHLIFRNFHIIFQFQLINKKDLKKVQLYYGNKRYIGVKHES